MYSIRIGRGKEKQLEKHHPWVFSGAVDKVVPAFKEADWANVYNSEGNFIAKGWYDEKSHIILHLLTWDSEEETDDVFVEKLVRESVMRRRDFFSLSDTTCFRLIHGEADFIPGVAADCYGREVRIIISSRFAQHFLSVIINTLDTLLSPEKIQVTTDPFYSSSEGLGDKVRYFVKGEEVEEKDADKKNALFLENGIWYEAAPGKGQKSGFYCDQRDNRQSVEKYCKGKRVLDVCSYTGGFTLHALRGGAEEVTSVDSSESALRHLLYQIHLNENKGVLPPLSRNK
ncbi:MAG: class I SAM-dependent rRNA methyltransferase, partial [Candidatus Ornithospirochaeta sp.]